jgi:hypothetical protein
VFQQLISHLVVKITNDADIDEGLDLNSLVWNGFLLQNLVWDGFFLQDLVLNQNL